MERRKEKETCRIEGRKKGVKKEEREEGRNIRKQALLVVIFLLLTCEIEMKTSLITNLCLPFSHSTTVF